MKKGVVSHTEYVSTRAPAKGATKHAQRYSQTFKVSTRAPAKGATSSSWGGTDLSVSFNSRSREGSDLQTAVISI